MSSSTTTAKSSPAPSSKHENNHDDDTTATVNTTTSSRDETKSMFFTTSHLMETMNAAMMSSSVSNGGDDDDELNGGAAVPRVELQRRMPDGSMKPADDGDMAVADFQSKMKQAAEMVSTLSPTDKVRWAQTQRQRGNDLFASGEYREAMDVYLTCLVALDSGTTTANNPKSNKKETKTTTTNEKRHREEEEKSDKDNVVVAIDNETLEKEIKLPVLLNLSLCTLKLGMYKKTEQFCDFALTTRVGKESAKVYYRRGKARMLMGSYDGAGTDFETALELLNKEQEVQEEAGATEGSALSKERDAISREMRKLNVLRREGKKNLKRQTKAMKKVLGGEQNQAGGGVVYSPIGGQNTAACSFPASDVEVSGASSSLDGNNGKTKLTDEMAAGSDGLYQDTTRQRRQYSTLRAKPPPGGGGDDDRRIRSSVHNSYVDDDVNLTCFQHYCKVVVRVCEKALLLLGDDEEEVLEEASSAYRKDAAKLADLSSSSSSKKAI